MPRTVCPQCGSSRVARQRYRGSKILKPFNLYRPYTCEKCDHHFSAVPHRGLGRIFHRAGLLWTADCPRCLSEDIRRTDARGLQGGWGPLLARMALLPAYRCNACRHQFFAFRRSPRGATARS